MKFRLVGITQNSLNTQEFVVVGQHRNGQTAEITACST